ncbi:hypothetical protein BC939DRAFT_499252 [Gamsiella multidivaricata]|uniref:uncharacterized protein n=1 Tax=Gamsiella multidivaricata TaxID=101098 RepID=UPI00221FD386|nr:uncharacterized protein BC939DRAFT_499252 [Gamsiella multidivaricata]KAG0363732.1 hypothetical protein BGZ54_008064 [Gamsiella multidivaricata]KAI7831326.1 hypothetical protein BC939DRAFT_499252 [Gamsiella multidivaricata]
MTTPQPMQDRPPTDPASPTSSGLKVDVNLNTENSAFYSEPMFEGTSKASPTRETTMPDIKSTPQQPIAVDVTTNQDSVPAEVAAEVPIPVTPVQSSANPASPVNPVSPAGPVNPVNPVNSISFLNTAKPANTANAASPASPVTISAPPTVTMNITATLTDDVDSDVEMIEDKDGPASAAATLSKPTAPAAPDAAPKENGIQVTEELQNKILHRLIEELHTKNHALKESLNETLMEKQSADDELNRTRGAYHDLHRQYMDLQQKLAKRDRDYEVMSKNYLEHVRMIRATDDDHGTIRDRLTQLKASIEHLIRKAQGGRSVNLNKEVAVEHFKSSGLLDGFPVPEDKLESYHLNLYMESVVMRTLISNFFDKPLSSIFDYNKGFKEIYDWMHVRNEKSAVRWRQQLCKMLADDPATKTRQEQEVATTAEDLSGLISKVYTNANEQAKIRDICNKAFELAIAMTGLESVITPVAIPLNTPFDEETMQTSLKSNPEGKVALVIFPAFKDKECAFDVRPKVWCY